MQSLTRELQRLSTLTRDHLGADVREVLFTRHGLTAVFGVRLSDGREAVVKLAPRGTGHRKLLAVNRAQNLLADSGYPCARPLAQPVVADGRAFIFEELVDRGRLGNAYDPVHRRAMAAALARQISLLRSLSGDDAFDERPAWTDYRNESLWPVPHDPVLYDFSRTDERTQVVDELARRAKKRLLEAEGPLVVGHCDWETQNMTFEGPNVAVAYDWDSLIREREPVLAGFAAGMFPNTGRRWDRMVAGLPPDAALPSDVPTPGESAAFLDDYASACGRAWTQSQRSTAAAATAWIVAYNARCDHSLWLRSWNIALPWLEATARYGDDYLRI